MKGKPPMKTTMADVMARIGQRAAVKIGESGLSVPCKVLNVKFGFGRTMYEVEPLGGQGRAWVNEDKISWISS